MKTTPAIKLSILDRLRRDGVVGPKKAGLSGSIGLKDLIESVRLHLNALLNTKCPKEAVPREYELCSKSLLTFGLPDFSGRGIADLEKQSSLRDSVQEAITRFEPRLQSITVTAEEPDPLIPIMRFRVTALLQVEPSPELVCFDTVLHADKALVTVKDVT